MEASQKKITNLLTQFHNTVYMVFDGACRDGFVTHFKSLDAESAIDAMLRPSSSKARRNGVTDEQGLTRYALVMMTINPQFDAHPQVQEFLSRSSSSPSQKIKMEALSEAKWREISSANLVDDWPRIFEVEMTGVKH